MEKVKLIREGKSKILFSTDEDDKIILQFKDQVTAFNGIKKKIIENKGKINCEICELIFKILQKENIPTHLIERIHENELVCQKTQAIPLEIIIRNVISGKMAERLDLEVGTPLPNTVYEICYKSDRIGDPLINEHYAVALGLCTYSELDIIYYYMKKINVILKDIFETLNIDLIDVKAEFGRTIDGKIILVDEISPDTCRLWDKTTNDKLDRDRFRNDLGDIEEKYREVLTRLKKLG